MMRIKLIIFLCLLLLSQWLQAQRPHRLILIGDAGELLNGRQPVVEAMMKAEKPDSNTTVVFLGDNIYPVGMPDKDHKKFNEAKAILETQLQPARLTDAKTYFIPGNHDWARGRDYGLEYALNQQRYIDSAGLPNAKFLPANGCPGPDEITLAPGVVLVILNSQWWLQQGADKPGVESDCDCKTGDEVNAKLKDIAARHANDFLIVATHHPFKTYSSHGGYFTLRQHLFPLTDANKKLWIPLPVIGSIYPVSRGVFGNIQDVKHPAYKKMIQQVTEPFRKHGATLFVHGHDHGLQHIVRDGLQYIVSGSGIHRNPVKKGAGSMFAASENGYVVIDFSANGKVKAEFKDVKQRVLYTKDDLLTKKNNAVAAMSAVAPWSDSMTVSANKNYNKANGLKRFLFGSGYRKVWAEPVRFRVFDISNEKGGLKILQKGGGKQTKSLRLEDKSGKQWVIRSINKNPISAVPPALRETFAVDIVQDQISAAHPYAPLVVPVLAEAAGVPHANPELVWIPADTSFGSYQSDFANTLCLFEEREPGISGKSYSTAKVLENLLDDNDDQVDQQAVLKARLFDLFISDWDRHEDQWRWGVTKNGKGKTYYPVPRDRDQAFFINNGFISGLVAAPHLVPSVQGMRKQFRNVNSFNFSTRYFDRNFLNMLSEADWQKSAEAMMQVMTDEVIEAAVNRLPQNIKKISGDALLKTLKAKRQYFVNDVMTYYRFLNRVVEVTGSNKKEKFVLQRKGENELLLQVYKLSKKDDEPTLLQQRIIDTRVPKELRLFGMEGADQFVTDSSITARMKLRLIGGKGKDEYATAANLKRTLVYDLSTEQNDLGKVAGAAVRTSEKPSVNEYKRTGYQYNHDIPQLAIGFNPDDGLSLGVGIKMVRHDFRKSPAAVYQFSALHSLSTRAFRFRASAAFSEVIGKTGLTLFADVKSPNNTTNFFGYGNGSSYPNPGKNTFRFYRARYNLIDAGLQFHNTLARTIRLQYGLGYQSFALDASDNNGRFILQTGINGLVNDNIFSGKQYLNLPLGITVDNRNNINNPGRGIYWQNSIMPSYGINGNSRNMVQLQTDLRFYASLNNPAKLVLAGRIGAGHITGDFEFFQALQLGNHNNLRGFRNHRFAGRSLVYNNMELRIKLFDFASYLFPATVGLIGFNDVGRVWGNGAASATWHNTTGAGVYVAPANMLVIAASVGFSKEETLPFVSLGFRF
jgi:UDP-2,3-diacylglucosamine pyrophosphatase LpxH